jgi:hypothetical protein
MAYGSELYLGFVGEDTVGDILAELEIVRVFTGIPKKLQEKLKAAHQKALEEIGMKIIDSRNILANGKPVKNVSNHIYVQGPDEVVRDTLVWTLEVDYDPREMDHTADDMLIGVSLISRYFPTFLDWNKESGGSGDTISLTSEVLQQIEVARKHLAPILPFIKDAPIVFRERHY